MEEFRHVFADISFVSITMGAKVIAKIFLFQRSASKLLSRTITGRKMLFLLSLFYVTPSRSSLTLRQHYDFI